MKKFRALGLLTLLFLGGCFCGDIEPYFDIQDIHVRNTSDYSGIFNDSVKFEQFAIDAWFDATYHTQVNTPGISFIPAALATSCAEPGYKGTKERIERIDLAALSDFNASHPKGSVLNQYLRVNGISFEDFLSRQGQFGLKQQSLTLTLTEKPDSTIKQAFRVTFTLTNGEVHTSETSPITIY